MASGVAVNDECKTAFQDVKLGHKYRYIIYKLTDDMKTIVVETRAEPSASYEDFLQEMKAVEAAKECRYAVYDVPYETGDGQPRNKICFIMWSPDLSKIKHRMVYASSKDALKKALGEGMAKEVQANEFNDLSFSNIMDIIKRTERT